VPENYFGEEVAARYDNPDWEMFDPAVIDPVVDFLTELAGEGRALELGIGTGRIALPLAERGVDVHGIDLSEAAREAGRGGDGSHDRRLRHDSCRRRVFGRVSRLQHDQQSDDTG
jgi:SAM-dependent methyltransferase